MMVATSRDLGRRFGSVEPDANLLICKVAQPSAMGATIMANLELELLQERVQRARHAAKEGNLPVARELLEGVAADLATAGLVSPFVEWLSAVTADGLELFVEAVTRVDRACAIDPVCPAFSNSRKIILGRTREALMSAATHPIDADPLALYDVLVRANQADREVHEAALAICTAIGHETRARSIATGLRALYPDSTAMTGTMDALDRDIGGGSTRSAN
jgi:hypothetical protein